MNNKIQVTILKALYDMKLSWNEKRTDNKYGSLGQRAHECIDKQVEECEDAIKYVRFCEEIETQDIDYDEEFTASNLIKIQNEIQNKADLIVIEQIRKECLDRNKSGSAYYLYKFGLSLGVKEYLVKRGFNIEHDYSHCGNKYTKISWY